MALLWIGLGGALGAISRYLVATAIFKWLDKAISLWHPVGEPARLLRHWRGLYLVSTTPVGRRSPQATGDGGFPGCVYNIFHLLFRKYYPDTARALDGSVKLYGNQPDGVFVGDIVRNVAGPVVIRIDWLTIIIFLEKVEADECWTSNLFATIWIR